MALINDPPRKKRAIVLAESKPSESGRDQAFITEAENLRTFYNRTDPETQVDILPFYGEEEFQNVKKSLEGITDEDQVFIFGHSGSRIGNVDNEVLAKTLKDSGVKNCSLGSCGFERYIEPYKGIPNLTYRGKDSWLGVNPRADNLTSAMYSRVNDYDLGKAVVTKPIQGQHYNKAFFRTVSEAINTPDRPMPSDKIPLALKLIGMQ